MKKVFFYIIMLGLVVYSCKKKPTPIASQSSFDNGVLCMNEGLFQQNNATLSFYSNDSLVTQSALFSKINGRGLGDTANDMIMYYYLNQLYIAIAVDVSSQIEIINATTLKSVKQIPIFNGTTSRSPRHLEYFNHYLYSINFDGTVSVIDLTTNSILKNINCGLNPDNSVIANNKLYVINSGGLNSPTYDNTITVIDLFSNTVLETFETAINCSSVVKDTDNEIYLISRGNYADISPNLLRLDLSTHTIVEIFDISIGGMTYFDNNLYYYDYDLKGIYRLDTESETINGNQLIDCGSFQNFYGIQIDPEKELIYLTDANNYVTSSIVRCYDLLGNYKYEFYSGLNTGKLIFK